MAKNKKPVENQSAAVAADSTNGKFKNKLDGNNAKQQKIKKMKKAGDDIIKSTISTENVETTVNDHDSSPKKKEKKKQKSNVDKSSVAEISSEPKSAKKVKKSEKNFVSNISESSDSSPMKKEKKKRKVAVDEPAADGIISKVQNPKKANKLEKTIVVEPASPIKSEKKKKSANETVDEPSGIEQTKRTKSGKKRKHSATADNENEAEVERTVTPTKKSRKSKKSGEADGSPKKQPPNESKTDNEKTDEAVKGECVTVIRPKPRH